MQKEKMINWSWLFASLAMFVHLLCHFLPFTFPPSLMRASVDESLSICVHYVETFSITPKSKNYADSILRVVGLSDLL